MMEWTIPPQLKPLFETELSVEGRPVSVVMRIPSFAEVYEVVGSVAKDEYLRTSVGCHFECILESVNGEEATREHCYSIYDEPAARMRLHTARSEAFDFLMGQGRVFAQCPHCGEWELDLTLSSLAGLLKEPRLEICPDRLQISVPALAIDLRSPIRPFELSYTEHLRFELPSSVVGLTREKWTGTFVPLDVEREAQLQEEKPWEKEELEEDEEELFDCCEGFDAMLALSLMLRDFGPVGNEITLKTVQQLSLIDFFFLDHLHRLTTGIDVLGESAQVTCGGCQAGFVPVRAVPSRDPASPRRERDLHYILSRD